LRPGRGRPTRDRGGGEVALGIALAAQVEIIPPGPKDNEVGVAVTMATNVFRQTGEGWRMILHHASPAPVEVTQSFNGTLQ